MSIQPVAFINLFFVPAWSLYSYRKHDKPLAPSLDLLFQYCTVSCFNLVLTQLLLLLPRYVFNSAFTMDSALYTAVALLSAWLLPRLYVLAQNIKIEVYYIKANKTSKDHKAEANDHEKDVTVDDRKK